VRAVNTWVRFSTSVTTPVLKYNFENKFEASAYYSLHTAEEKTILMPHDGFWRILPAAICLLYAFLTVG